MRANNSHSAGCCANLDATLQVFTVFPPSPTQSGTKSNFISKMYFKFIHLCLLCHFPHSNQHPLLPGLML